MLGLARQIKMPLVARPAVGGLLIGIMAIWFPEILGVGYDTTDGINQAILGRSFFQAQLESRGIVLHDGPHRTVMKDIRVSDFMWPLKEGEPTELPEGERERALQSNETLETALRAFDTLGAERLPVVETRDRSKIVGFATQARALRFFNKALIAASVEEHR